MNALMLVGIGFGCVVGLFGLYGAFSGPDQYVRRFRPEQTGKADAPKGSGILKQARREPSSLMKALVPAERAQLTRVQRQLANAGFAGKDAVISFYLIRAVFGVLLPSALLAIIHLDGIVPLPNAFNWAANLTQLQIFQLLGLLAAAGFYGPTYWLNARASARKRSISEAFPNALDLLQIGVEAGLGFDAAMARVAAELEKLSPAISEEFVAAQREILAGRDRDKALLDMAERMDIEEVFAFVNVVLQSKRFGTNISEALLTYADEMRQRRELKAQEKANRLPVQMSAVMACLMLPALFMIALSPIVIRYMRYMAE